MPRRSESDIKYYMDIVNSQLERLGSAKRLVLGGRYGYYAIDTEDGYVVDTGLTKSQVYDIVLSMSTVLGYVEKVK